MSQRLEYRCDRCPAVTYDPDGDEWVLHIVKLRSQTPRDCAEDLCRTCQQGPICPPGWSSAKA